MWMINEMNRMTGILQNLVGEIADLKMGIASSESAAKEREKMRESRTAAVAAFYGGTVALVIAIIGWILTGRR